MTKGYPWDQKIMPKSFRCKKANNVVCEYENCSLYYGKPAEYTRHFDTCPDRERVK